MKKVSAFDVANYINEKLGKLTAMKLQKLVYYSQAWSLVWDEDVLFEEEIQAWANGPVVPLLYQAHKGKYQIPPSGFKNGNSSNLTEEQKETVDKIIKFYGKYNSQQLSDLTHMEAPWKDARKEMVDGERGSEVISLEKMSEYYSSIQ